MGTKWWDSNSLLVVCSWRIQYHSYRTTPLTHVDLISSTFLVMLKPALESLYYMGNEKLSKWLSFFLSWHHSITPFPLSPFLITLHRDMCVMSFVCRKLLYLHVGPSWEWGELVQRKPWTFLLIQKGCYFSLVMPPHETGIYPDLCYWLRLQYALLWIN